MAQLKSLIVNGVSRFNNTTYSNLSYVDRIYSANGFVFLGPNCSSNNILMADGSVLSKNTFSTQLEHPYLPLVGGTMTGAINVSAASNSTNAFDKNHGLNFGSVGHIGYATTGLGVYSSGDLWLRPGQTGTSENTNIGLALTSTEIKFNTQKVWYEGNDGPDSGLDADTLDTHHADYFAPASWLPSYLPLVGGVLSGGITVPNGASIINKASGINFGTGSSYSGHIGSNGGNVGIYATNNIYIIPGSNINNNTSPSNAGLVLTNSEIKFNNSKVLRSVDCGHDNGIDADTLDGKHGAYFAYKDSPALTGTPTAPTPSVGTNNTQIATTAFVSTAVSNAVGTRVTYKIKKLNAAQEGFLATYKLVSVDPTNNTETEIDTAINIPKDFLVKSGEVKTVTTDNSPVVGYHEGDKYLDFVVNVKNGSATDEHIYILVKDLVDIYEGGAAISVDSNNKISAYLNSSKTNGLEITTAGIGLNLASSSSAGAMSSILFDKLTGIDLSKYLPLAGGVMTGAMTASTASQLYDNNYGINFGTASSKKSHIGTDSNGNLALYSGSSAYIIAGANVATGSGGKKFEIRTDGIIYDGNKVLTTADYGHGNGINADQLDGHEADYFAVATWMNSYLKLNGGTMTGAIRRYYSATSEDPMLSLTSNNSDAWLWRINHGSSAGVGTSAQYGFGLKYLGSRDSNDNSLALFADNQTSTQRQVFDIKQSGDVVAYYPLHWQNTTALPKKTTPQYFLTVDAFTSGGMTTYSSVDDLKSVIGLANYLPLSGGEITNSLIIDKNLVVNGNTTLGDNKASDIVTINAVTTAYNDLILRADGGNSPKLIFNRTGSGEVDWMTYVSSGDLYFAKASDASSWTTAVWIDDSTLKIHGNLAGNADTATKLQTARNIALTGGVTGNANFDGSANITIETTLSSHTHPYAGSNSAGGAANTVIVDPSDTNQTYNMVFHNNSKLYSNVQINANPSTGELSAKKLRASGNDIYVGSAANAQCHMQYDSTMKCIKFMFD